MGVIIFGTDYGMVGQFNEQVAAYASDELQRWRLKPE
jgi:F0F1-type ATP synthase gamma subunit